MTVVYFGFAVADSMFNGDCMIKRQSITEHEVKAMVEAGVEPCINLSHAATIAAMTERFGITIAIPEVPPHVTLLKGDKLLVMSVRGLPRLTDRREYSHEEIAKATFSFASYCVES